MATTSFNIESNGTVRINIEPNDNDIKFKTENGAVSIGTTGTACLDLYFKLVRNIDNNGLLKLLTKSWEESPIDTMKLLFQSRDSRGGKGDRKPFLFAMQEFIIKKYPEWFIKNLENIPEYGRWLDLIEIVINKNLTDDIKQKIIELVANQLEKDYKSMNEKKEVSLLAKWFPSEGNKWDKGNFRRLVCYKLFLSDNDKYMFTKLRKEYITPLRNYIKIVESKMCAKEWNEIEYSHVPSVAMTKLRKAFKKNDEERFKQYIEDVKNNKTKINADQVYPHDLVRHYLKVDNIIDDVIEEQWKVLVKKYDEPNLKNTAVISDVSGSMEGTPMEVSIALGILISTIAKEPFHKQLITFCNNPTFHNINNTHSLFSGFEISIIALFKQFNKISDLL